MVHISFNLYSFITLLLCLSYAYTANIRLYCGSTENFISTDLDEPLTLLDSECFNKSQETVIYAFGFISSPDLKSSVLMIQTYLSLQKYNVFMIDWQEEVSTPYGDFNVLAYAVQAVPNSIKVGQTCGHSLHMMSESSLNLDTTHLIGHSLGAQMVGFCGKELQKFDKNVSRITGLDPAGPLFDGLISLDGLTPRSAEFVDVLHTNPGLLGTSEEIGQVNIWFNCNEHNQPNCDDESLCFLEKVQCNHGDSILYYTQAILHPTAFQARKSDSCCKWNSSSTVTEVDDIIYVGLWTDRRAHGNYYLSTNADCPFGKGLDGLIALK